MTAVKRIIGPNILLSDGTYFDFDNPSFGPRVVEVIANSLANLCRFTGHGRRFYSVAEHSVHVSRIVPPHLALYGLLHDAAEAFVGDVAKPLKAMLPDYAVIEDRVERALFAHLGLPLPMPPEVKAADRAMLAAEQIAVMGNRDGWHHTGGEAPADVRIEFWGPDESRIRFLSRYRELTEPADAGQPWTPWGNIAQEADA
jgi:hypothetical protein